MEASIIKNAFDILTPVIESSMILAAHYVKGCNRSTVTAQDIKYSMRFCARNVIGKHIGTLFPELQDEDSDDDDGNDIEEVDEDDEPFTRYQGEDAQLIAVNTCYDTWSEWEPVSMVEKWMKNAIDSH
jgi:hypothetical protein